MNKEELIRKYGIGDYVEVLREERGENNEDPEKRRAWDREWSHKGGKWYAHKKRYQMSGIPHEKNLVRGKHQHFYRPYKQIIAPNSELHHLWRNDGTAAYSGVALVEKDQHRHGIIDVIRILEGQITLLTETEIRGDK